MAIDIEKELANMKSHVELVLGRLLTPEENDIVIELIEFGLKLAIRLTAEASAQIDSPASIPPSP